MDGLFDYMTEQEKYFSVLESVMDNKMVHLNLEFDKLMIEHAENLSAIETKVLMESGTEDDLVNLYTIEAEEIKEKGKGILGRIVDAVKDIFRNIKQIIFGKKDKLDNLPKQVKLPEDPDKLQKETKGVLGSIQQFFSGNKKAIAAVAVGAVATTGAVVVAADKVKPIVKNLEEYANEVDARMGEVKNKLEKEDLSPEEQKGLKGVLNNLQSLGKRFTKIIGAIPSMGTEDYKEIAAKNKEEADAKKQEEADKKSKNQASDPNQVKDQKDDETIRRSNIESEHQRNKIRDLTTKSDEIQKQLDEKNAELKELEKSIKKDDTIAFGLGESKTSKEKARLKELSSKKKLSAEESREYLQLKKKLSGNMDKEKSLRALKNEIAQLEQRQAKIANSIKNRENEKDAADDKAARTSANKERRNDPD